ncbi:MAG: ABC transporter permease, partial [Candidatus Microbacterium stercoravium]
MTIIDGQNSPATMRDDSTAEKARDRAARRAERRAGAKSLSLSLGVLLALLVLWQIVATVWPSTYWPPPLKILQRMAELWLPSLEQPVPPGLTSDVIPSLLRMGAGFGLAVVFGIVLGMALGLSRRFEGYTDWILQFFRAIPPPTLFPVFL